MVVYGDMFVTCHDQAMPLVMCIIISHITSSHICDSKQNYYMHHKHACRNC